MALDSSAKGGRGRGGADGPGDRMILLHNKQGNHFQSGKNIWETDGNYRKSCHRRGQLFIFCSNNRILEIKAINK